MVLVSFDPSIVIVKQSFIVSQTVSCPFVLSWLVLIGAVNGEIKHRVYGKRQTATWGSGWEIFKMSNEQIKTV